MYTAKYIITDDRMVIIFSAGIQHKEFRHFNPISAGFISIGVDKDGNPSCTCYGESFSLGLKSREEDTTIAKSQIVLI